MMKIVGITGGIGAGKSTICDVFKALGIPVYNADLRARELMNTDSALKQQIVGLFGKEAYFEDLVNRDFLAKTVFSNTHELRKLNNVVHPAVGQDFKNWVPQQSTPYVIKEAALLIESGSYKQLDVLINVQAEEKTRIQRVLDRDPFRNHDEVLNIVSKQASEEERNRIAHHIIDNSGRQLVIPQVLELHHLFSS
jgi:dephospho-CoA kinase